MSKKEKTIKILKKKLKKLKAEIAKLKSAPGTRSKGKRSSKQKGKNKKPLSAAAKSGRLKVIAKDSTQPLVPGLAVRKV
jgi:hypothetical protein